MKNKLPSIADVIREKIERAARWEKANPGLSWGGGRELSRDELYMIDMAKGKDIDLLEDL